MFKTKYGPFDGDMWERFCQACFKIRYADEGYQEIVASPGDFGLEGFTLTGRAFQCYCPDHNYPSDELYEKQRDKISKDLQKLKQYQDHLKSHLASVKIGTWYFVTPEVRTHKLHAHCQKKAKEVQEWCLDIISHDFKVQIHDIDYYAPQVATLAQAGGEPLTFDTEVPQHAFYSDADSSMYEKNINSKNSTRVAGKPAGQEKLKKLNAITWRDLLSGDDRLRKISNDFPHLFHKLLRIINQYAASVEETCVTWEGTNEELLDRLRNGLEKQISAEVNLSAADRNSIVRHIVATWLAVCPISFG